MPLRLASLAVITSLAISGQAASGEKPIAQHGDWQTPWAAGAVRGVHASLFGRQTVTRGQPAILDRGDYRIEGPAVVPAGLLQRNASLVALPEPASLALILVGVLGVTAVRSRMARRAKPDA